MLVYRMEMEGGHKFGPFTMGDTGVSTPEAFDEWFPPTLAEELESRGFRKMIYDAKDFIVGKKTGTQVLFDPATAKLITE